MEGQLVTQVIAQLGVAMVVMVVIVKVIVPMFIAKAAELVEAIKDGTSATNHNTTAIGQLAERVSRIEGALDHRAPTNPPPLANGSRDMSDAIPIRR